MINNIDVCMLPSAFDMLKKKNDMIKCIMYVFIAWIPMWCMRSHINYLVKLYQGNHKVWNIPWFGCNSMLIE